ncbi:MAG: hypothetical protein NTU44_08170 [Bacteroidetes bacterium]|nr:hypothetical protein [Bacteroidota bacterium]
MKAFLCFSFFLLLGLRGYSQQNNPDSNYIAGCGTCSYEISRYMKGYEDYRKKIEDSKFVPDSPIVPFTGIEKFSANQIIRCGNFRIYYEDFLNTPPAGFADTIHGGDRRNILCQVIQYIQSIIAIDSQDSLDLYVDRSFSLSNWPPVYYETKLAAAGPYYPPNTW